MAAMSYQCMGISTSASLFLLSSQCLPLNAEAKLSTLQRILLDFTSSPNMCCWIGFRDPGMKRTLVFNDACIPELPWKDVDEGNQKAKRNGHVKKDLLYKSGEALAGQSPEVWVAADWPCSIMSLVAPCTCSPLTPPSPQPDVKWRHLNWCWDPCPPPGVFPGHGPRVPSSIHCNIWVSLMPNQRPIN